MRNIKDEFQKSFGTVIEKSEETNPLLSAAHREQYVDKALLPKLKSLSVATSSSLPTTWPRILVFVFVESRPPPIPLVASESCLDSSLVAAVDADCQPSEGARIEKALTSRPLTRPQPALVATVPSTPGGATAFKESRYLLDLTSLQGGKALTFHELPTLAFLREVNTSSFEATSKTTTRKWFLSAREKELLVACWPPPRQRRS